MADYATLEDLKAHWPALPADQEAMTEAQQKIHEASVEVRGAFRDIDRRLASGDLDAESTRLVVCRMVKRAMDSAVEAIPGVTSSTQQTGPFTQTLNFTNPDGNIYLSKSDRRLLAPVRYGRAFTIHPGGA